MKLKVGQNECPEGEISGDLNRSGDLLFNPKVEPFGDCFLDKEGFSLEEVRAWWSVREKGEGEECEVGEPWFAYGGGLCSSVAILFLLVGTFFDVSWV